MKIYFFDFHSVALVALVISLLMIFCGLAWRFRKKYKNDIWVQNTGTWTMMFGVFFTVNIVAFSVDMPTLKLLLQ